jgi:hypothetical protein
VRARLALICGLALTAIAVGITLSRAPLGVARSNMTITPSELTVTQEPSKVCQRGETLPRGTTAIRLSLLSLLGPALALRATSGERVLTAGSRGSGWIGKTVTVPVTQVPRTSTNVSICFAFSPGGHELSVEGQPTAKSPAVAAGHETLPGRLRIEYLRPQHRSWWSMGLSIARRMGLGHPDGGAWIALVPFMLLLAAAALTSWIVDRDLR